MDTLCSQPIEKVLDVLKSAELKLVLDSLDVSSSRKTSECKHRLLELLKKSDSKSKKAKSKKAKNLKEDDIENPEAEREAEIASIIGVKREDLAVMNEDTSDKIAKAIASGDLVMSDEFFGEIIDNMSTEQLAQFMEVLGIDVEEDDDEAEDDNG